MARAVGLGAGRLPPGRVARLRRGLDRILRHRAVELTLALLIVVEAALLLAGAAFDRDHHLRRILDSAGDVVNWIFVGELVLRFIAAPRKGRFFAQWWLDLLAVFPSLLPFPLLRVLRLLRLFRAGLIVARRLRVFGGVFRGAGLELMVLVSATVVLVLAGAVVIHFGERSVNPDFATLEKSVWYSVLTLVAEQPTVGNPTTEVGRAVTLVLILGGMTVFGMFVGTVSASMVSRLSHRLEEGDVDPDELDGHVIICGWNHSAPKVLREVFNRETGTRPVVIMTEGEKMPEDADPGDMPPELLHHVSGDYTRVEILEQAAAQRASLVILLADKSTPRSDADRDARTVLAALTIERLSPGIFTCAELRDRQHETLLRRAGVEEIVVADEYSGYILGSVGRNRGLVSTLDEILSTRYGNAFHKVAVPKAHDGATVAELHRLLAEAHHAILVSLETERSGERQVWVNPAPETKVQTGDHLVVIARVPVDW